MAVCARWRASEAMMYAQRLARLAGLQRSAQVDCSVLVPGPNLSYLSGLTLSLSERPIVAFFPVDAQPAVLLPAFEQGRVEAKTGDQVAFYPYTDEEGFERAFAFASRVLALDGKRLAVEDLHMRVLELRALQDAAPTAAIVSWERTFSGLRATKDAAEIGAMRRAIAITEKALRSLISRPLVGLTEREIADQLRAGMMDEGADGVAFIIVVAGPNGTDPHAGPSDRAVQAGEFLTIDCGATLDGYVADITRTFALGEPSSRLVELYEAVRSANAAAKAAVGPGVAAQELDRAARQVLRDAGFGQWFTHRTGHGLGLEVHEPPYIVEGNVRVLEPGMVFTVEPGAYVPGLGGVRIEDDILVTEMGMESLTSFPRELIVLA